MGLAATQYPAPVDWTDAPDGTLVAAIAEERDRDAFAELFSRYATRVRAFLGAGGLAPTLADELTQEILLEVWRRAERYDPARAGVSTWIFTIARSRRIDTLRRERVMVVEAEEYEPVASPELQIDRERSDGALRAALGSLPSEQVAVLDGAYFAGKSMSEIAEELRLPVGTVKSRVRLAVDKLRGALHGGRA
ncbi:MAG: sigma-70 family RNA polymerase sigma factor [Myxococcota bacterium]